MRRVHDLHVALGVRIFLRVLSAGAVFLRSLPQVFEAYCQNQRVNPLETQLLHEGRVVKGTDTIASVRPLGCVPVVCSICLSQCFLMTVLVCCFLLYVDTARQLRLTDNAVLGVQWRPGGQ